MKPVWRKLSCHRNPCCSCGTHNGQGCRGKKLDTIVTTVTIGFAHSPSVWLNQTYQARCLLRGLLQRILCCTLDAPRVWHRDLNTASAESKSLARSRMKCMCTVQVAPRAQEPEILQVEKFRKPFHTKAAESTQWHWNLKDVRSKFQKNKTCLCHPPLIPLGPPRSVLLTGYVGCWAPLVLSPVRRSKQIP